MSGRSIPLAITATIAALIAAACANSGDITDLATPATSTTAAAATTRLAATTTLTATTLPPATTTTAATTTAAPTTTGATTTTEVTTTEVTTTEVTTTTVAPTTTPAPTTTAAATTTTSAPSIPSFGTGTMLVGVDIQPGRYIAVDANGCYWQRLKDLSGDLNAIIANNIVDGQAIVDIAPTDEAFDSTGDCGTWVAFLGAEPVTQFGDGDWVVGAHITPGRWRSSGGDGCYWQRLRGFGGTLDEIIANDIGDGVAVVDIRATDKGFSSVRCGTWQKVG